MHVALINFLPVPADLTADEIFVRWPSLPDIAEAIACAGTRVSVVQMAAFDAHVRRNGIDYHFVDSGGVRRAGELGWRAARTAAGLGVDVLHVHSLAYARHAAAMARYLPTVPVLLQDHADGVPAWWLQPPWRRWYGKAKGIAFTAVEQADPFVQRRLFDPRTRLFAIPESSSRFSPGDRATARAETGLYGNPCVLSIGHLKAGKDPLTMLEGVARASERVPDMQLWCAYGTAPLFDEVRERIDDDPRLMGRVHLLGDVPHSRIEQLLRSSDIYVSASLAESAGYALLEAMACGIRPVVTDIPSYRSITDGGRIGRLWRRGDAAALADALVSAAADRSPSRVREYFDAALSFNALGRQWATAYRQLLDARDAA